MALYGSVGTQIYGNGASIKPITKTVGLYTFDSSTISGSAVKNISTTLYSNDLTMTSNGTTGSTNTGVTAETTNYLMGNACARFDGNTLLTSAQKYNINVFSLSFWIYPLYGDGTSYQIPIASSNPLNLGWTIEITPPGGIDGTSSIGNLTLFMGSTSGSYVYTIIIPSTKLFNRWNFVAFSFNNGILNCWVNGVLISAPTYTASNTLLGNTPYNISTYNFSGVTYPFTVGGSYNGASKVVSGTLLDTVKFFYNQVLDQPTVTSLFNELSIVNVSSLLPSSGLVAYFDFTTPFVYPTTGSTFYNIVDGSGQNIYPLNSTPSWSRTSGITTLNSGLGPIIGSYTIRTISIWIKVLSNDNNGDYLIDFRPSLGNGYCYLLVDNAYHIGNGLSYIYVNGGTTQEQTPAATLNTWMNLTFVTSSTTTGVLTVAMRYTLNQGINAKIAYITVFSSALTAAQNTALYNAFLPKVNTLS